MEVKIVQATDPNGVFSLQIPNIFLYHWHSFRDDESYVQKVNKSISDSAVMLVNDSPPLEHRIRIQGYKVSKKISEAKKSLKGLIKSRYSTVNIFPGEVVRPMDQEWMSHCLDEYEYDTEEKERVIEELVKKVKTIIAAGTIKPNYGKGIDEVEERQRRRKIAALHESCKKALWFSDSFNLDLLKVCFRIKSTKEEVNISYEQPTSTVRTPDEDNETLYKIVYLMDKFGISDEFYHELSMTNETLPRSYRVKKTKNSISSDIEIQRLPKPYYGCYRPVKDSIAMAIKSEFDDIKSIPTPLEIKISGDGAPFSRTSSFIIISISLTSVEKRLASDELHAIAAVKGSEDYSLLKEGLKPVVDEINQLLSDRFIEIDGHQIELELFFGGDYKFLLLFMGMNQAHSDYSCLYCEVHKTERWKVRERKCERTLRSMYDCVGKNKPLGCIRPPLLQFELSHIVLDELHVMLRITDILIRNLVWGVVLCDDNVEKNREKLVKAIRSCGVSFEIWKAKGGNNPEDLEWSSLRGNDRRKLLEKLPDIIPKLLQGEKGEDMRELWMSFNTVMSLIGLMKPLPADIRRMEEKVIQWVDLFLSFAPKYSMGGFQKKNITPYIHMLAVHIPDQMKRLQGIKRFSGQPVEKKNDDARRYYAYSNRMDPAKNVLVTDTRVMKLKGYKRVKRSYNKTSDHWEQGIFEQRKRKDMDNNSEDTDLLLESSQGESDLEQ